MSDTSSPAEVLADARDILLQLTSDKSNGSRSSSDVSGKSISNFQDSPTKISELDWLQKKIASAERDQDPNKQIHRSDISRSKSHSFQENLIAAKDVISQLESDKSNGSHNNSDSTGRSKSDSWSSLSDNSKTIELGRPRKWFTCVKDPNIVHRKNAFDYFEKVLFNKLPPEVTIPPTERYYKEVTVKLSEEEIQKIRLERKKEAALDKQLKEEAEEIGFTRAYKYICVSPTCECGVTEHPARWSDNMIEAIHNNLYRIRYKGLQIDKDVLLTDAGEIKFLRILMDKRNKWTDKVEEFLVFVNLELGYTEGYPRQPPTRQVYLALDEVNIIGCAVIEPIKVGYKITSPVNKQPRRGGAKVTVDCGINRIWVLLKYRRRSIATALLDLVRFNFKPGDEISTNNIAFSEPNLYGRYFAKAYCKKDKFVVY